MRRYLAEGDMRKLLEGEHRLLPVDLSAVEIRLVLSFVDSGSWKRIKTPVSVFKTWLKPLRRLNVVHTAS